MILEGRPLNSVVIATTAFEVSEDIWRDYFSALNRQSDPHFDILIINDGFTALDEAIDAYPDLSISVFPSAGSIARNRQEMIRLAKRDYSVAIFCDFDDYCSDNRVSVCVKQLECDDVILNDLILFKGEEIITSNFFSELMFDGSIGLNNVLQKNYFGLSNTSVRLDKIPEIEFSDDLIAVDWFFYTLLLMRGLKVHFVPCVNTYYRQYEGSLATPGRRDLNQLKKEIKVKKLHYRELMDESPVFKKLYIKICSVEKKNDEELALYLNKEADSNAWWSILELE